MGNEHDAEDVVQEAAPRAFRYFRTFSGGNGRAWFLRIVRNTSHRCRSQHTLQGRSDPFDDEQHSGDGPGPDPESLLLHTDDVTLIERAMSHLPDRFHELLVLRELDELSYQAVADVLGVPIGTVMSGLSRARRALRDQLVKEMERCGIATRGHQREQDVDAVLV
jgi:RNA polymerase sigma-70 factor (ECF subfamily)